MIKYGFDQFIKYLKYQKKNTFNQISLAEWNIFQFIGSGDLCVKNTCIILTINKRFVIQEYIRIKKLFTYLLESL